MGAGASANTAQQILEASPEDLQAALANIPADKRAAIKTALGQDKSAVSGVAPYMQEAFGLVTRKLHKLYEEDLDKFCEMQGAEIRAEMETIQEEFGKLMEKSFDHHDTKGAGVLDAEDAAVFFKNMVGADSASTENVVELSIKFTMNKWIDELKATPQEDLDDETKASVIEEARQAIRDTVAQQKEETEQKLKDYRANAEERNAAAFKILDVNGDGTLQKSEFLSAMKHGSKQFDKFMAVL